MKRNDPLWYTKPTRQSYIAIFLICLTTIKSIVRNWWPLLLVIVFRSDRIPVETGLQLTIATGSAIVFFSVWSYLKFYFYVTEKKLHVQRGIFRITHLEIPFDRVQSIAFEQGLIHRVFGVVRLRVDTAGSAKEEFEFTALGKEKAHNLREYILSRRDHQDLNKKKQAPRLILTLDALDLIKIGISQNHLRTAGIILAFILSLRDRIKDFIGSEYLVQFDNLVESVYNNALALVPMLFIVLLVVSFVGTLVLTFFRYYDLKLWSSSQGFSVKSGLVNRNEMSILKQKVQMIRWSSNPLKKLFNIVSLRFYQASGSGNFSSSTISVPGCSIPVFNGIQKTCFKDKHMNDLKENRVEIDLFYRRALFTGVLPAVLMVGCLGWWLGDVTWIVIGVLWLGLVVIYQWYLHQNWRYGINDFLLYTEQGVIEMVYKMSYLFNVQSVSIRQSPYQRRKKLSTLLIFTASGVIRIPYIRLDESLRIKNKILYIVENSQKAWM